jgi:hypothetical protein
MQSQADETQGQNDQEASPVPLSPSGARLGPGDPPKLLDQIRARIRYRHYSIRTERAYVDWARRFVLFHGKRHPREMGAAEVERFLTYLANERGLAASSHQQALAALLFLYREFSASTCRGSSRSAGPGSPNGYLSS